MRIEVAHSSALAPATSAAIRTLLEGVFPFDLTGDDLANGMGGMHAIAWEGEAVVGHACVVMRRLVHGGRALRAGYVEGVGVRADHRRRGLGAALMEAIEHVIRRSYELGALSATEAGERLYARRGWRRWEGPLCALTPAGGIVRTPEDDGGVFVLPVAVTLDLGGALVCDPRPGDPW